MKGQRLEELRTLLTTPLPLDRNAEQWRFSIRVMNYPQAVGISTIGELVSRTELEMLNMHHALERKSLDELKEYLEELGLAFGMDLSSLLAQDTANESKNE